MELAALKVEVATLSCETAAVEFKSAINTKEPRFWVQIARSILAMHNSGGGVIVFGLDSAGKPVGGDLTVIRAVDPIQLSDKVRHYTDRPLPDVKREEFEKNGVTYPGWIIPPALIPVPFSRAGDVHSGLGKPDKLFHPGQIYVRRGASSVPADAGDIAVIAERIRTAAREEFAQQMTGLVGLPAGHEVKGVPAGTILTTPAPGRDVHLINDPTIPGCVAFDMFDKYPYRQKELIAKLATRVSGCRINQFDIQCIKKVYAAEFESKRLLYSPLHSSAYFSEETVEWIAGRIGEDPAFLDKTRAACRKNVAA
jgi:hypothetical protein